MEQVGSADSWSYQLQHLKNGLDKLRKIKMGFFMHLSAKPSASLVGDSASKVTQGELQAELRSGTVPKTVPVRSLLEGHLRS